MGLKDLFMQFCGIFLYKLYLQDFLVKFELFFRIKCAFLFV